MTTHDLQRIESAAQDGRLSKSAAENLTKWLTLPLYARYREEIAAKLAAEAFEELNDAFYQLIPFGTGGRRGTVGLGPNRMNDLTVASSAQGVANKLKKTVHGRRAKVVVAYDTRTTSAAFTMKTACVLAGNDVDVYLFDGPRSTPELSFMIGDLKADAGIVISASHNPPSDNGFKAYWSDGGQVVPPLDAELIAEVEAVSEIFEISFEEASGRGRIHRLTSDDDRRFYAGVLAQGLGSPRELRIVYTPLNGAGMTSVYPVLRQAGFKDLHLVECQKDPDGSFPNVPKHQPNPEVTSGLDAAIALARAIKADLVLASDPDADRLACAVADGKGDFQILSGNQCAALMMDFIAGTLKARGELRPGHRVYSTLVSSPLFPSIARAYGLQVKNDLLVGFKWIGDQIKRLSDPQDFLFGSEESIGFMKGPQTRDKDASVAALLFCELAAKARAAGRTVPETLDAIYAQYGYFADVGVSIYLEGAKGSERMSRIMQHLRENTPRDIGGVPVVSVIDRASGEHRDLAGNLLETIDGPKSNILIFRLRADDKSFIAVRPSGTEPKIKFYLSLFAETGTGDLAAVKARTKASAAALGDAITALAMAVE